MILQSDPQWLPSRKGKLTASRLKDVVNKLKNANYSASRHKLMCELVAEMSDDYMVDNVVTKPMQRGLNFEQEAKEMFEIKSGMLFEPAALIDHPMIDGFAATPDGFHENGLLEIKVPMPSTWVSWRSANEIPEEHIWQLVGQQAVTGKRKTWFVAYMPERKEKGLFVKEFTATDEQIQFIEKEAQLFLDQMHEMLISIDMDN